MHVRQIAVSIIAVAALTACGTATTPTPTPTSPPTPTPTVVATPPVAPSSDLTGITVSEGANPQITVKAPWAISKTTTKVIKPGTSSQVVPADGLIQIHYRGVNGTTGKEFDSNFGGISAPSPVKGFIKGFTEGLVGQQVGSRVLIAIPSADGYPQGQGDIKPGDTILFVVDILSAEFAEPTGTANELPAVAPKVTVGADGPSVTTTGLTKPTALGVYDLVTGTGPAITADKRFVARFRSFTWDGKVFEDAWAQTQSGGLSGTIPGWEKGLLGKKAGSRVLLVIPPEMAYPDGRSKAPTLKPGETLVYVIDITYVA